MKKKPLRLALAGGVLLAGLAIFIAVQRVHATGSTIPTVHVQKGTVELDIRTTGELRTPHASVLAAPSVNGTMQIVHLLKTGTPVKTGDVVVEFDPIEQQFNLEQSRSQLSEAEQQIAKQKADADVKAAEDQVALLKAKFDVRRAELEVSRNELVSEIDAKKNLLNLEEAKRRLAQLEQDVNSRAASNKASLALLVEKRQTALLAMQEAQHNIDQMTMKAPIAGIVTIKDNQDAARNFGFPGMTLPEYREGDLVSSGRYVAEILDMEQMETVGQVNENDRANVNTGQSAEIRIDARPQPIYQAKVKSVAGMTSQANFMPDAVRRFDVAFSLTDHNPGIRPGTSAEVIVHGAELKDKLYLPRQCLFEKDGKRVVYVKHGSRFDATEVKIAFRSDNQIVVEGLTEGTEVALVDPENQSKQQKKSSAAPVGVGQ
jgi:multidrug resistance efflux pump